MTRRNGQFSMDAKRIQQLRNLGPRCQSDLNAVGIYTLDDIQQLGVESTFIKVMKHRLASGNGNFTINASYLYAIYGALHDCDRRDILGEKKTEFKQLAARLRKTHAPRKKRK